MYARLTKRADLKLWITFQSDFEVADGALEMSDYLASHFGFKVEDGNSHLGVPNKLWKVFKELNLDSFSISNYSLDLIYYISNEESAYINTSTGSERKTYQERKKLKIKIPVCHKTRKFLSQSILLSLHCIDGDFNSQPDNIVTISKIRES